MSDYEFEARLERLFSQPPPVADPGAFAARVQGRLERGGGLRQVLIGGAGVVGGIVAASQMFGSGVLERLGALWMPVRPLLTEARPGRWLSGENIGDLAGSGEVVWIAAAMLALAVGVVATRVSDAF